MAKFKILHDKSFGDIRVTRMYLQIIKTVYSKNTDNINLNGEKINGSAQKLKISCALYTYPIYCLKS